MATVTQTVTEEGTTITLRGSSAIVAEFFEYAVNSILYQRGILPPEAFKRAAKYGLTIMKVSDEGLVAYFANVMRQLEDWLLSGDVQQLVSVCVSMPCCVVAHAAQGAGRRGTRHAVMWAAAR